MSNTPLLDQILYPADLRAMPDKDLPQIAMELRHDLVEQVSKTGGHLGAGLGVVELTITLHHTFNTPDDRIIWDVGHQAYPPQTPHRTAEKFSHTSTGEGSLRLHPTG